MGVEEPRLIRLDSDEPEEYVLSEGETRIGRSRANAICLRASTVSRFHCYLIRNGDVVRVFDGKSKNPARLNGEPVSGQRLRTGQVLVVGKAEFVYQGTVVDEAPAAAAPAVRAVAPALEPRAAAPAATAWTRPETDAAMAAPAPRMRRPRRRHRVRSREPALLATLGLILAAPVVVWLVVAGMRSPEDARARRIPPPDTDGADASEIEARIAAIEDMYRKLSELADEASKKRTAQLEEELHALKAELVRNRQQPSEGTEQPRREVIETPPWERSRDPRDELQGKLDVPEDRRREEPTTVVVPRTPPLVRRRREELREIQERIERNLEDYATQVITPAVLVPDLEKLWLTEGKDAAAALLALEKHARDLLKIVDTSIEKNRKTKEALLAIARSRSAGDPPSSDSSPRESYAPATGGRETDQRLLDVYEKAEEIQRTHRRFLDPLRRAILDAIARVSAPEGLEALRAKFPLDDDEELCLAIAGAFEGSLWQASIPTLAGRLSSARSDRLRGGLQKTLTALVGEDLGDRSAAWLEWWKARR